MGEDDDRYADPAVRAAEDHELATFVRYVGEKLMQHIEKADPMVTLTSACAAILLTATVGGKRDKKGKRRSLVLDVDSTLHLGEETGKWRITVEPVK